MLRERHKCESHEADSIDVLCRGGQVRSSVEVAVMAMERRDLATAVGIKSQLNLGGTFETNKTL